MDYKGISVKFGLGAIGAGVSYLIGTWGFLLVFLLTAMFLDVLTGLIASGIEGRLSSKVGFRGCGKKVLVLVAVLIGYLFDVMVSHNELAIQTLTQYNIQNPVQSLVCLFYLGNELVSIAENFSRSGVPLPPFLLKLFDIVNKKADMTGDGKKNGE